MKRHRTSTLELALLLVLMLMLPLQGFATAVSCAVFDTASAAEHHCQHGTAVQHHSCGTCCSAAIAVTSLQWTPPRSWRPPASFLLLFSPPKLALDRLDRPPRPTA
ncbi:MAG TPA: hypothetical protein VKH13_13125 [Steroidobacteraceae bacterium]|nr:hypothetical protein [Steroidobacteraceae bacterium]